VKFVFSHSKLRKQLFAEIFKISGGQDPLPTTMTSAKHRHFQCYCFLPHNLFAHVVQVLLLAFEAIVTKPSQVRNGSRITICSLLAPVHGVS